MRWEAVFVLLGTFAMTVAGMSFAVNAGVRPNAYDHLLLFLVLGSVIVCAIIIGFIYWVQDTFLS